MAIIYDDDRSWSTYDSISAIIISVVLERKYGIPISWDDLERELRSRDTSLIPGLADMVRYVSNVDSSLNDTELSQSRTTSTQTGYTIHNDARKIAIKNNKEMKEEQIYVPGLIRAFYFICETFKESQKQGTSDPVFFWSNSKDNKEEGLKTILKKKFLVPSRFHEPMKRTVDELLPGCIAGAGQHRPSERSAETNDPSE